MKALLLAALVALPAFGQEPAKPADAPLVLQYPNGSALLNKAAFEKIDVEMKRLQQVEREHKAEPSWVIPILIGVAAGLVVGIPTTAFVVSAAQKKP